MEWDRFVLAVVAVVLSAIYGYRAGARSRREMDIRFESTTDDPSDKR